MKIKGRNAVREALVSDTNIIKIMASNNSKDKTFLILGGIYFLFCVIVKCRLLFIHIINKY